MPTPTANQQFTLNTRRKGRSRKKLNPGEHQEAVALRDYLHPQQEITYAPYTHGDYRLRIPNRHGFTVEYRASCLEHAQHLQRWYGGGHISRSF